MARDRRAVIVVDLGFGDAGKGAVTDALVRALGARAVVRFHGGAQAGHNVVTPDGRHHTFSQFGAGTFVPGVRTILSRHVVVHPTALLVEARHLASVGVPDALDRVAIDAACKVVTPFHQAANRLRELLRGDARHGSCGVGVGEVMRDALEAPDDVVRMSDLRDPSSLRLRLRRAQDRLRGSLPGNLCKFAKDAGDAAARTGEGAPSRSVADANPADTAREGARAEAIRRELRVLEDPDVIDAWIAAVEPVVARVDDDPLRDAPGTIVFEGAQGVLLDEWRGFHPYTTWSTCTFDNALELVGDREITRLGVIRTYATRHGAGPFPTESPELLPFLPEPHNGDGPWQGAFRVGPLDLVLLRYALAVTGGVDALAVTHLDALARMPSFRVAHAYAGSSADRALLAGGACDEVRAIAPGAPRDLSHHEAIGEALRRVTPTLSRAAPAQAIALLEDALGVEVRVTSEGPTARHVRVDLR